MYITPNNNIDHFYNLDYDCLSDRLFDEENNYLFKHSNYTSLNTTTARCFTTSNEHLEDFKKYIDFKNKRVATVGSSGDQVFTSLLNGSKDITLIDGNVFSRAFIEYKMAMIENLPHEEFLKLLSSSEYLSYGAYRKISHSLSPEVRQLFDTLMLEQTDCNDKTWECQYPCAKQLESMITSGYVHKFCDFYTNKEDYIKLQQILRDKEFKLKFVLSDFEHFPQNLDGTFDIILLSNIIDYVKFKKFEEIAQSLYQNKLNKNGTMQTHYRFIKHFADKETVSIAGIPLRHKTVGKNKEETVYFMEK